MLVPCLLRGKEGTEPLQAGRGAGKDKAGSSWDKWGRIDPEDPSQAVEAEEKFLMKHSYRKTGL